MPASGERLRGVNEVGEVESGPSDLSWGRTQPDGAALQLNVTKAELFSAQSTFVEDSGITQAAMSFMFDLIFAELTKWQLAWGVPAAQLTGDLEDVTPTEEVLTLDEDSLGSVEKQLYAITPGPASTRRIEAASCQLADIADIPLSKEQWQTNQVTWDVRNTADGTGVLIITDAL